MSNDFSWSEGGRKIELHRSDAESWRVTFVETGLHSTVGERLRRVRHLLQNEDVFLANYADGLSDVPLTHMVGSLCSSNATASFLAVPPPSSMHAVEADGEGFVTRLVPLSATQHRMNGGFFVLRNEIFDSIEEGDELVEQPFARLIAARKLLAYNYDGFWQAIDTLKDKIAFDRMEAQDKCPWMIWRK
jgi:glucose-1-phosphate cytidylyltransferase